MGPQHRAEHRRAGIAPDCHHILPYVLLLHHLAQHGRAYLPLREVSCTM